MDKLKDLTITDWHQLFYGLQQSDDCIFWVVKINHQKQCYEQAYLSTAYEQIVGWPREEIFKTNEAYGSYVVDDKVIEDYIKRRHYDDQGANTQIYQIRRGDNRVRWIRDTFHTIYDENNEPAFAAGIAFDISDSLERINGKVTKEYQKRTANVLAAHSETLDQQLARPIVAGAPKPPDNTTSAITLPAREYECATWLLEGLTSKEIAREMLISHRTVEVYIERMKSRFRSKNKIQLVRHLIESGLFS